MVEKKSFTFIDLFAGIGGMRIGFERAGGQCVLTCEIDEAATETYRPTINRTMAMFTPEISVLWKVEMFPNTMFLLPDFPVSPTVLQGFVKD